MRANAGLKPKRVLMSADTIGGVWTYSLELARALRPHGVEVILATMGRRLSREQRQEASSIRGLEVIESDFKLEWMEDPWGDVMGAGEWLLELESRLKPDLIHLNGYALAAVPWKAPKIVVGHSCVLSWWRAVYKEQAPAPWEPYREAVLAGLRAADLVVAPSRTMLAALVENYGPIPASTVIPNGRAFPSLTPRPKEKFILSVGRLWDEAKNVDALAAIASDLSWPVCLAGDVQRPGGDSLALKGVQCLGRMSEANLLPWFERASIYALPARYEPFGLSALEAAIAGCALVLGDIPTLREIWGNAALFVPPDEPDTLGQALKELISSPAWVAALGAKARWAARSYTPERMAQGYLSAYAGVLMRRQMARHRLPQRRRSGARLSRSISAARGRHAVSGPGIEELAA